MDTQKAALVIGITLLLVILFNLAIYAAVKRRRDSVGEIELFRRVVKRARDPWEEERDNLENLAKAVAELQKTGSSEDPTDGQ